MDPPELSRRRFLASVGSGLAAAGASCLLPPSLRRALAEPPPHKGSLADIEHVVILMQENRSFDHYFGTLSGVRGFADPHARRLSTGRSVFYQPDSVNPAGYVAPFHLNTATTSASCLPDPDHEWPTQHGAWNHGKMDAWLPQHRAADGENGPLVMGYHTRADLPFHYALADAFTVCDRYFCSALGDTAANRLYSFTGTIDVEGRHGGPIVSNDDLQSAPAITWTTYPERLQRAGISWNVYIPGGIYAENVLAYFAQYSQSHTSPLYIHGVAEGTDTDFENDVHHNRLPRVSWIIPPISASEHPPFPPAAGAAYIYRILAALAANRKIWAKTVLFLTYDENGGFFDHVPPPVPPPNTPGEYLTGKLPKSAAGIPGPIGLGFRVPTIVISPWSRGGRVCSEVFDHTSLLRFLETRFGVHEPNISAWRRRTCGDLTATLRLHHPARSFPALPTPTALTTQLARCTTAPPPTVPATQSIPAQEPGTRPHNKKRPHDE